MGYLLLAVLIIMILIFIPNNEEQNDSNEETLNQDDPKYGGTFLTVKGEFVKSKGEARIANFLYKNKIKYIYEPQMRKYISPDFYIPDADVFVEYWGLANLDNADGRRYRKSMLKKIRIYRKYGLQLISLFPQDIQLGRYKSILVNHILGNN